MSVWSSIEPFPEDMPIIQIGLNDWEMGKNFPTELAIRANVKDTLIELNKKFENDADETFSNLVKKRLKLITKNNWTVKKEKLVNKLEKDILNQKQINPSWMLKLVADVIDDNTIIVEEGLY